MKQIMQRAQSHTSAMMKAQMALSRRPRYLEQVRMNMSCQ